MAGPHAAGAHRSTILPDRYRLGLCAGDKKHRTTTRIQAPAGCAKVRLFYGLAMTADTSADPATRRRHPAKPPVGLVDWAMLILAIVSVGLLVWVTFFPVDQAIYRGIVYADYSVCGLFAVEFLWRWRGDGWAWRFPLVYWYEVLGMIPVTSPAFRGLRLLRIIVVVARLGRATDRAFGDRVFAAITGKLTHAVVTAIKRPITIAVLDEVGDVLRTGHYTRNVAAALTENRSEMDSMILELVRNDRTAGRLKWVPFHDDVVRLIADTTFRMVFQVLTDPRTDEFVSDLLRENVDQIRSAVRGKLPDKRATSM